MRGTWEYWSERILGYIAEQTPTTERYVALRKIQIHLDEGYREGDVFLIWNQGNAGPCRKGINSKGIPYNSCSYKERGLALLQ